MRILIFSLLFFVLSGTGHSAQDCAGQGAVIQNNGAGPTECCSGLVMNPTTNICADSSPPDLALVSCSSDSSCEASMGCFPQRYEDLFFLGGANEDNLDQKNIEPKTNGSSCNTNAECESYNCTKVSASGNYQCAEKKICRYASIGEVAKGTVRCEPELEKKADGSCGLKTADSVDTFYGISDPVKFDPVEGKQCQFNVSQETRTRATAAMKAMRGLEWLLADDPETGEDCMKINLYLRNHMKGMIEDRKKLLTYLNQMMSELETDSKQLLNAKSDSAKTVTIDGETIKEKDLYTRKISGHDMLKLMWRRNIIFQNYEKGMMEIAQKYSVKLANLSKDILSWSNHNSTEWDIDGVHYAGKDESCRGGGFLGLGRRKIYKRWANKVPVTDQAALPNSGVLNYLKVITQEPDSEILTKMRGSRDATGTILLTGVSAFGLYGWVSSLFSSPPHFMDPLKKMYPNAVETRNYYRTKVAEFYKKKFIEGNGSQGAYIFEPEILPITAQACIGASGDNLNKECLDYKSYLDDLADSLYAQSVAYAYHDRDNYKNYFGLSGAWRRKLLSYYEAQLIYLGRDSSSSLGDGYYASVIKQRDIQNSCLEKLMNHVSSTYLADSSTGIVEGKSYYAEKATSTTTVTQAASSLRKLSPADRLKYSFDLSTIKNDSLKATSNKSGSGSSSDSASGKINASTSTSRAMSDRVKEVVVSNKKAEDLGMNVAEKEKSVSSVNQAIGQSGAGGKAAMQSSTGNLAMAVKDSASASNSTSGNYPRSSASSSEQKKTSSSSTGSQVSDRGEGDQVISEGGKAGEAGYGDSAFIPYAKGMNNYNSGMSGRGGKAGGINRTDPTGMSDEEKDVMMSNYERNKDEYKTETEDNLFKVISKTYVRNLGKVLTKKKELEEE